MKDNIQIIVVLFIIMTPMMIVFGFQSGMIASEDTGVFSVARFTSTDNNNVQIVVKGTRFLSGPYSNYYSLPGTWEQFGSKFSMTVWFDERYEEDDVWKNYEHGPFDITFYRSITKNSDFMFKRIIELNNNNVTVYEI